MLAKFTGFVAAVEMSSRTFNLSHRRARSSQPRRGLGLTPTGHRVHLPSVIRRLLSLTQGETRALPYRQLIHLNKAFMSDNHSGNANYSNLSTVHAGGFTECSVCLGGCVFVCEPRSKEAHLRNRVFIKCLCLWLYVCTCDLSRCQTLRGKCSIAVQPRLQPSHAGQLLSHASKDSNPHNPSKRLSSSQEWWQAHAKKSHLIDETRQSSCVISNRFISLACFSLFSRSLLKL